MALSDYNIFNPNSSSRQGIRESTPLWLRKSVKGALVTNQGTDKATGTMYNSLFSPAQAQEKNPYDTGTIYDQPQQPDNWQDLSDNSSNSGQKSKFAGTWQGGQYYNNLRDYSSAQVSQANKNFDAEISQIKKAYENGLLDYNDQVTLLNQARDNAKTQMSNLVKGRDKSLKGLGTARDETLSSQNMYFNNVSPEAYQSQQGVYAGKAQDTYNEGVTDVNDQYNQNEVMQKQYLKSLANQMSGLSRSRSDLETKTNLAKQQATEQNISAADALRNQGMDFGDNNVLPNYAPPSAPKFNNYDIGKFTNKLNEGAIGQLLKGGNIDPAKYAVGLRNNLQNDNSLSEEEKQQELAYINWLYGGE